MKNQSIEFQNINKSSTRPEMVRKSFRIPVEDHQNVWVLINNKRYPIVDIGLNGVGIALEDNLAVTMNQTFTDCELNIFNDSIKHLNGRVVHSSSSLGRDWKCGIQWMDMQEAQVRQISMIVLNMKEQLLKDDTILKEY